MRDPSLSVRALVNLRHNQGIFSATSATWVGRPQAARSRRRWACLLLATSNFVEVAGGPAAATHPWRMEAPAIHWEYGTTPRATRQGRPRRDVAGRGGMSIGRDSFVAS